MDNKLLEVKNLSTSFFTAEGEVKAVSDVSYHVNRKEVIAIVGESGCGKSVTQLSVLQLIQTPPGKILGGEALFEGVDLLKYKSNSQDMLKIRGSKISMIFQEPMTSLNPVFTIGYQMTDMIRTHLGISKKEAEELAVRLIADMGIPDAQLRLKNYPFQMSGGMRQRVMIAMAISCNPKLIIADELTTALDVTTQAQIMELLMSIIEKRDTSLIIITHNLGLVARYAQRIYVMYAGRVIESGTTRDILSNPGHPYTKGLLDSVPRLDQKGKKLIPIKGNPPKLIDLSDNCAFLPRCLYASDKCKKESHPILKALEGNDHFVACHNMGAIE